MDDMDRYHHLNFLPIADFLTVLLTGYLAYVARTGEWVLSDRYLLVILVAGFITVTTFGFARVYLSPASTVVDNLRRLFFPLLVAGLVIVGVGYLSKSSEHFSRIWATLWFTLSFGGMVVGRMMLVRLGRSERVRRRLARRVVLVGGVEEVLPLYRHLGEHESPWLMISGLFFTGPEREWKSPGELPEGVETGGIEELLAWSKENAVDDLVVVPPRDEPAARLLERLKPLHLIPANIHVGPVALLEAYPDAARVDIAGLPLINTVRHPLSSVNRLFKLSTDLLMALLLLPPLLPLMGLIALAVRLDSKGPVLFRQRRYGFHNEVFTVYKFRTMSHGPTDDPSVPQARRDDPRVTRLGRLLRRFSFDELPQLFNVLNGTMSLVGPRPHAVPHNDKYSQLVDCYLERHKVKPGITGWAQVNGHRGETDTVEKMHRRVEHDLFYVKNWSLLLDVEILMRTVLVVLSGRNAY